MASMRYVTTLLGLWIFLASAPLQAKQPRLVVAGTGGSGKAQFEAFLANLSAPLSQSIEMQPDAIVKAAIKRKHLKFRHSTARQDALSLAHMTGATHVLVVGLDHKVLRVTLYAVGQSKPSFTRVIKLRRTFPDKSAVDELVAGITRVLPKSTAPEIAQAPPELTADPNALAPAPDDVSSARGQRWRPAAQLGAGLLVMQRTATLSSPGLVLPCYCGTNNDTNPPFAGFVFTGEFYPLALRGTGASFLEGLGVYLEIGGSRVESYVGSTSKAVSASTVLDIRGGVSLRYVLWDSNLAAQVVGRIGYSYFTFPLASGQFPSLSYVAPSFGLQLAVPIGTEQLALVVGGAYSPLTGGRQTALGSQTSGYELEGGAGLRLSFDVFEIVALYRYSVYHANYSGGSVMVNGSAVQSNVALKDALNQLVLTGGVRF